MDNVIEFKGRKNNSKRELYLFYSTIETFENLFIRQNIHTLVIIGQYGISSFNAISELIQLQELWIVESGIKEVPAFKKNCQMKKLYLYSNDIPCIPNLEICSCLTVLCLSGNKICNLENLEKLICLQELNLADNNLRRINKVSLKKSELRYLNLAGNHLNFIRDIRNLSRLQRLNSLVFADPLYGNCPLVALCNYRAYVVHYLPHIKKLDHYSVCEKERQWINQFFKKQVMFYNVLLHKQLNVHLQLLKHKYEEYEKKMHYFKNQLYVLTVEKNNTVSVTNKAHDELPNISKIELNKKQFTERKEMAIIESRNLQQQLIISMNYCGNINFVEYNSNSGNKVTQLCKQFLEESLCSIMKQGIGITDLRLHKVTKVSNKQIDQLNILKNECSQSDECNVILKVLASPGVTDIKKWPFNLFKMDLFIEEELIVTNCLAAADAEWLNNILCMKKDRNVLNLLSICEKRRICVLIQTTIFNSIKQTDIVTDCLHIKYADYWNNSNEICHKFKLTNTDIRNPMFVIEYEYILPDLLNDECKNPDVWCILDDNLCVHLSKSNITRYIKTNEKVEAYNFVRICISGQNISSIDNALDLPNLKELDISFNKLDKFPNLNFVKRLKKLNVCSNNIQLIHIEETLSLLEVLDISWNCLTNCFGSIKTFTTFLPSIYKLNICNNPFKDVIDPELVKYLMHYYLPKLQLINNCTSESLNLPKNYFPCAFNMCKLNDKRHIKSVYLKQNMKQITLKEKRNVQHAKCIHISQNLFAVSDVLTTTLKMQELCATCCLLTTFPISNPLKYLTKLNLGSNFISDLDYFTQENFPVLKYLDLTNNLITSLETMGTFYTLQEFYCGNNEIRNLKQIDNVKTWQLLCIIDLCNNPIITDVLYKQFLIFHINNIKYISGECVQSSDISEARRVFGNKLDKYVLNTMYKTSRLTNITQLSLVDCFLSKVNLSAEFLPQLESLDLSKNQITCLWGLDSFQYLHSLCLSYNCLEVFYESDCKKSKYTFPKLCTLFLDHNCIKSLTNFNQEKVPMIKHLFLNNNHLQSVNEVNYCSTLESLILDYNEIETLNTESLIESNNLKILSLENNKIKSLEFTKPLQKLKKLYIANNCLINEIEIQYLSSLKNLEELTLEGNPLYTEINMDKLITPDFELKHVETEEI